MQPLLLDPRSLPTACSQKQFLRMLLLLLMPPLLLMRLERSPHCC